MFFNLLLVIIGIGAVVAGYVAYAAYLILTALHR